MAQPRRLPAMPPNEEAEIERSAHALFKVLDTDIDGKITEDELKAVRPPAYRYYLNVLASNPSKLTEVLIFWQGMKKLKIPVHEDEVQKLFHAMDINNDKAVTYEEAKAFVAQQRMDLWRMFCLMDENSDGKLDQAEVEHSLHALKIPHSNDEIARLFQRLDRDHSGFVTFDEWTAHAENLFRFWEEALLQDNGDQNITIQKSKPQNWKAALSQMAAGAIAGCTSRTVTAPMERLKVLYQVSTTRPPGYIAVLKNIYKESGWAGFWRGNGAHCMKVAPEAATKFFTFETVKRMFADKDSDLKAWQRAVAGGSAGVSAHVAWFPLEVIKTRLQTAAPGVYDGIIDCVRKTMASEGNIRPFYRGISASIMATVPHSSIDLAMYETLKQMYIRAHGVESVPPGYALFGCATIASTFGQLAGYPFHLVKSRFIAQGVKGRPKLYSSIPDVFRVTFRAEGLTGFYRGLVPSFAKAIPSHGVTLLTYEMLKRAFGLEKKKHKKEKKH